MLIGFRIIPFDGTTGVVRWATRPKGYKVFSNVYVDGQRQIPVGDQNATYSFAESTNGNGNKNVAKPFPIPPVGYASNNGWQFWNEWKKIWDITRVSPN